MSTTINSASTGAERFIRLDAYDSAHVYLTAEIPDHDVFFNIAVNKEEFVAAVAEETGAVLIEPKRITASSPSDFFLANGVEIGTNAYATSGGLREAAAHYLALAAEKEAEEASQAAEVTRVLKAISEFVQDNYLDEMRAEELAQGLVEAGLTVKEEA